MTDTAVLATHDAVLFDLDGTVYRGSRAIPGAAEAISRVREHGTPVRFVTNNASKAPEEVAEHLTGLGVSAKVAEVNTSAQAGALVLRERLPAGAAVLVVGTEALADEVAAAGLRPVRRVTDNPVAVVQGHSPDTGWADLAEACLAIRNGALWVACNIDPTLPTERGQLPGNGSMVAALRTATNQEPKIAGKPRPPLLRAAAESAGAVAPLVVGDRLDTDIAGAVASGFASLAVLTGVTTPAALLAADPGMRPRYVAADLTALDGKTDELEIGPRPGWHVAVDGDVTTVATDGGSDSLELLRTVCDVVWRHGTTTLVATDEQAAATLTELGLA